MQTNRNPTNGANGKNNPLHPLGPPYLVGLSVLLEVLDDLLHVVLEVGGVVLLGAEAGLHQPVVEHHVHPGLDGLLRALVRLLRGGVGARKLDIVLLAGDELREKTKKILPFQSRKYKRFFLKKCF